MIFCDEVFRFIQLEETLFFTNLDIDLNSFENVADVSEGIMQDITERNLRQAFTCDRLDQQFKQQTPSQSQIDSLIDSTFFNTYSKSTIWKELK